MQQTVDSLERGKDNYKEHKNNGLVVNMAEVENTEITSSHDYIKITIKW